MKTGRTLQELAIELERQNKAKRDFIVNSTAMNMENEAEIFSLSRLSNGAKNEVESFQMSDLFHRQIGSVLQIPSKYYDLCRKNYTELLAQNVNGWLQKNNTRHTIRTLDGTARAFLSDRYRRIDNAEIAQTVLPIIAEMQGAKVESCEVTDSKMYLKIVNEKLTMDVVPGDTVQAGIVISNSEVGLGAVSVMPLIYRLICKNGMCVNHGKRKYHVGRENEESWELFSDETLQADENAFMMKLADIVRTATNEAKFSMIVEKLRESIGAKITASAADVVELTAKQYGFTKDENDNILQHLITGADLSLYGLSNAVTRTANDCENYDRATALESAGWQIVTMSPNLWKQINGGKT